MPDLIDFTKHTVNGLRPRADLPRNAPFMQKMRNIMATERRGKPLMSFNYPVGFAGPNGTYPHAELYFQDRVALLYQNATIATINTTALTSTTITTYDATDPTTTKAFSAATQAVQIAAFGDLYFGTNGASIFYKIPVTTSNRVVTHTDTIFKGVVKWRDRPVLIAVSGSAVSSESFTENVSKWKKKPKKNVVTHEDRNFDTTWLIVGPKCLGESDIPATAFMAMLGYPSESVYYSKYEPLVHQWIESGEIDFLPLSHTGAGITGCVQGDDLIIFGADGVSKITTAPGAEGREELMESKLLGVGIPFNGVLNGDAMEQCFVTKNSEWMFLGARGASFSYRDETGNELWAEHLGNNLYRLGYAEYLSTLTLTACRMAFDAVERYWWLSDSEDCYMLSRSGLSRPRGLFPVSCIRLPGYDGIISATVSAQADDVEFQPHPYALPSRELFEILWFNMQTTDTPTSASDRWKVTPVCKLHKQDDFTTHSSYAKLFDGRGRAMISASGVEHQHLFTHTDRTKMDCDGLTAELGTGAPSMRMWHDA